MKAFSKAILLFLILSSLLSLQVFAQQNNQNSNDNLYEQESLTLRLDLNGGFNVISKSNSASLRKISADLFLVPQQNPRQEVTELSPGGSATKIDQSPNTIEYEWQESSLGRKDFSYSAIIKTKNQRTPVGQKVDFPLTDVNGLQQYLQPTDVIDSDNKQVAAKALELAQGETDLFSVSFKISSWVNQNVKYDLNTLTEEASQSASWVLENRQGVCDEMTSLFIAMMRSLGVPARFVKGISFTNSDLFSEPWQPHGWAEVYFPDIGWVSFDITFKEYGYVDVTHIKLKDGVGPLEADTRYEWLGNDIDLQTIPLTMDVTVLEKHGSIISEISLSHELLSQEIGFGSYNLITAKLKNNADYYAATSLLLAIPEEIIVSEQQKGSILLAPGEEKDVNWVVRVPSSLDNRFRYTFPFTIQSDRGLRATNEFYVSANQNILQKSDVEVLIPSEEKKTYSENVIAACKHESEVYLEDFSQIDCLIENNGNQDLKDLAVCISEDCEVIDLPSGKQFSKKITLPTTEVGWKNILVKVDSKDVEKIISLPYKVLDVPVVSLSATYPEEIQFNQDFTITISVNKESFANPGKTDLVLQGGGFSNVWALSELNQKEDFSITLTDFPVQKNNKFIITAVWSDSKGQEYKTNEEFVILGKANNFNERFLMALNAVVNFFS